jgi:hypothetical protein
LTRRNKLGQQLVEQSAIEPHARLSPADVTTILLNTLGLRLAKRSNLFA